MRSIITLVLAGLVGSALAPLALGQELEPATNALPYAGKSVVRVVARTPAQLHAALAIAGENAVLNCTTGPGLLDLVVDAEQLAALRQLGLELTVKVDDLARAITAERDRIADANARRDDSWFIDYKTFDQFNARLTELVAGSPSLATSLSLGNTLNGRPINGIKITGPGNVANRPAIFFNGGQHAREWANMMSTIYIADRLLRDYGVDPVITGIVNNLEWHIVPIANGDGYVYTWTDQRLWRKNRRNNGDGTFGVDLNRNWGFQWGGEGSSGTPSSETYRGTGPFSEPETQRLRDYIIANPRIEGSFDVHTFSQLFLSPWGYTINLPADAAIFDDVNARMVAAVARRHGTAYVGGPTYTTIYPAAGVSSDWTYGDRGILGWGVELRDTGDFGFELPASQILPTAEEVFDAFMEAAAYIAYPLVFGYPDGVPSTLTEGQTTDVRVTIRRGRDSTLSIGTERLFYRVGTSGNFTMTDLATDGGGVGAYRGTLPAADCGDVVQFYFQATAANGAIVTGPAGGASDPFEAIVEQETLVFDDDFQTNKGWAVASSDLTDGAWERGVPAGGGGRGDPPADFDGSGSCYLTANRAGNSDVDGGPTRLTSPAFALDNLESGQAAEIRYAYWFSNDDNDADRLSVEISSNNGGSWIPVNAHGNSSGWRVASFDPSIYASLTGTMRVRFNASDNPNDSVTESAVDAFEVVVRGCPDAPPCVADFDGNGTLNVFDFLLFQTAFSNEDPQADLAAPFGVFNVFDFLAFQTAFSEGC